MVGLHGRFHYRIVSTCWTGPVYLLDGGPVLLLDGPPSICWTGGGLLLDGVTARYPVYLLDGVGRLSPLWAYLFGGLW